MKMQKYRFDEEWIREQWENYLKEQNKVSGISVINFTRQCLEKMRAFYEELK